MNKLFPIVLALMCFGLAQDEYPYFSDPLKQLAFEKKRIYLFNDNIKMNNKDLTEADFLSLVGLEEESKKSYLSAQQDISHFNDNKNNIKESYLMFDRGWFGALFLPAEIDYTKYNKYHYSDMQINKPKRWLIWLTAIYSIIVATNDDYKAVRDKKAYELLNWRPKYDLDDYIK